MTGVQTCALPISRASAPLFNLGRRRKSDADARVPNRAAVSSLRRRVGGRWRGLSGEGRREIVAHRWLAPGETALVFPLGRGGSLRPGTHGLTEWAVTMI